MTNVRRPKEYRQGSEYQNSEHQIAGIIEMQLTRSGMVNPWHGADQGRSKEIQCQIGKEAKSKVANQAASTRLGTERPADTAEEGDYRGPQGTDLGTNAINYG